jgi:hypothetical protein
MAAAISLPLFVTGCVSSGEKLAPPTKTPIPDLDARTASPCVDPGFAHTYGKALIENREYALCERDKHMDTVKAYRDVQKGFGGA